MAVNGVLEEDVVYVFLKTKPNKDKKPTRLRCLSAGVAGKKPASLPGQILCKLDGEFSPSCGKGKRRKTSSNFR